jgi:glyoxylase-like metal-dependent hydrolase (beta-lactamase superfamily II)/rhodanese-related sulfurtransferase
MARPFIVPFVDEGLGNSSYLVDLGGGRALAVDPSRDPSPYLAEAGRRRLHIAFAAETHLHADFVSGSRELAADGATVLASASGGLRFPHRGLDDGDEVDFGGLTLRALATPGHTPEHLTYLLLDGDRAVALFTGGSLLVDAVARTDLISPDRTEELGRAMYHSIRDRLLSLPDDLPVYPTHGAGSFCSGPAGGERTTTIGRERASNPLLAAPDEDAFVELLLSGLGTYPPYFLRLRAVNRCGPRVYGHTPTLPRLTAAAVRQRMGEGAEVVDVRPIAAYAAGHIPGSLSIALRPAFASWLGWLVSPDRPIIAILDADQDRDDLVQQALKVGYEHLVGELDGGVAAWRAAGFQEQRLSLVDVRDLPEVPLLDVRQDAEYRVGHVPGAVSVELGSLAAAIDLEPGPLAVMCGHGERAMTGASVLERTGRTGLSVVVGGPDDWAAMPANRLEISP